MGAVLAEVAYASRGHQILPKDDDTLLNSNQTRAFVGGVSHMCLWRWVRDERVLFPEPVKLNGRNYWRLGTLRQWQAERGFRQAA